MTQLLRKAALTMLGIGLMAVPLVGCSTPAGSTAEKAQAQITEPTQEPEVTVTNPGDTAENSEKNEENKKKKTGKSSNNSSDSSDGQEKPVRGSSNTSTRKKRPSSESSSSNNSNDDKKNRSSKKSGTGDETASSGSDTQKKQNGKSRGKQKTEGSTSEASSSNAGTVLKDGDAISGGTYTADGKDESVLEASGTVVASVTGAVLNKTGGSATSADAASFQGVNAGVRVYGNAKVTLTDTTVNASAKNATAVFAYENGVITMDNCTVTATGGGAGGIQVAGGGTLYGTNLTVTSASKAAIRSDRGGGTMLLDGGTYTSTGSDGCPAIYSTADITIKNAECVSTNSRAVIIEGKNTVTVENCSLSGNDQSTKAGSIKANVLLYQSASGDASVGTSVFTLTDGTMKANSGAMFYCTNTASIVNLENADLQLSDDGTLLIVSAGRWGKDGKNGGDCTLNAKDQVLTGSITVDAISSLSLNLAEGSAFTGVITGDGKVAVTLDGTSSWKLTADSYVTSLSGDLSNLDANGYSLYVDGIAFTK